MSFFDKIKQAIFGETGRPFGGKAEPAKPAPTPAGRAPTAAPRPAVAPAPAPVRPAVDVAAVLEAKATARGKPSNWRTSIVDLLQLLDLDSNLAARKELAQELNVHAGDHGSAEQNIALHKAVMKKLAENGGQVPAELRD